ncbi:MAG TPA: hypothetical protein VHL08_03080 [Dongiaceae bacterium]|jgi:hypothetical protein|nr:hypothetical protein [Dongiaceae bacterium]
MNRQAALGSFARYLIIMASLAFLAPMSVARADDDLPPEMQKRVDAAGAALGFIQFCEGEQAWQQSYEQFMRAERRRGARGIQTTLIGVMVGATQETTARSLHKENCTGQAIDEAHHKLEELLR